MPVISILQLSALLSTVNSVLRYLREKGLLSSGKFCQPCGLWRNHVKDKNTIDGYTWRCPGCKKKLSIRDKSFWSKQKLPLSVYVAILYFFSVGLSGSQTAQMLSGEAHFNTIYDWFNLYRDLMSRSLLESPVQLGGVGKTVEIDESKWGRKRKYNRGRVPGNSTWIFGLIERESGKVALFTVPNRSAAELIPKIQQVVLPGTTIISDQWAAYCSLSDLGYTHHTVNHSENFVDPVTGAHTQTIEGFWGNTKGMFKTMHGTSAAQLPSHLDEIMFRWNNKEANVFDMLLEKIAVHYAVEDQVTRPQLAGKPLIVYAG